MLRTSPFPFEVDFGIVGSTDQDAFSIKIPFESPGTHAVFVTSVKDKTIKVYPVPYSSVALLRIKTTNMAAIQMEMMRVMKECNMKLLHTNGACESVDCFWEGTVKDDPDFIEAFASLKHDKKGMIDNALILFLDAKYTRFKKLVEKHDLGWLVKSFLSLEIGKASAMDGLQEERAKAGKDATSEFTEIIHFISTHVI